MSPVTGLELYSSTATEASARMLRAYSTSFGLASRLLGTRVRPHIASLYALVRVADEIVDGPAAQAGVSVDGRRELLDALEAETLRAMTAGFSTNPVVHAFACTARAVGIDAELITPFFSSMRRDLEPVTGMNDAEFRAYVHGSAEVIGLMCLKAFLADEDVDADRLVVLERGAMRLGAALQTVNFLRDLADDVGRLERRYLPGVDPAAFDEPQKAVVLREIARDLQQARTALLLLPASSRLATAMAAEMFAELAVRLHRTPASELLRTRVSVPPAGRLIVLARAVARSRRPRGAEARA